MKLLLESTQIKPDGRELKLVSQSQGDAARLMEFVQRDRKELCEAYWEDLKGDGSGVLVIARKDSPQPVVAPEVAKSVADIDTRLVELGVTVPKGATLKTKLELIEAAEAKKK